MTAEVGAKARTLVRSELLSVPTLSSVNTSMRYVLPGSTGTTCMSSQSQCFTEPTVAVPTRRPEQSMGSEVWLVTVTAAFWVPTATPLGYTKVVSSGSGVLLVYVKPQPLAVLALAMALCQSAEGVVVDVDMAPPVQQVVLPLASVAQVSY